MKCSEDINNEFFVHHTDTLVITQRMYTEQDSPNICSCLNINQSAGNISKDNSNTHKNKTAYYNNYLKPDESPEKCNMIVLQASTLT